MKKVFILSLIIVFTLVSFIVPMGSADASTSRVAIISKWEGTVEVQKSGGTKVFKAFNNMSLNQGDIVTTGKDSTAVLKFSNGTSSDDTLTLEADTTVTFTKLTNKSGTTTKVRMQKGNAWVDVKSIQNKDDEFTLETPTAIMGVRGTHFMVAIDPKTNQYVLSVVAGIVTVDNTQNNASTNNNNSAQMVYPGMVLTELANESNVRPMTNADLNNIIKQAPEVLIAQLIQQARDIINENQQYLDAGLLSNLPIDLEALKFSTQDYQTNVSNIMSYLFGAAIQEGIITQERFNELVKELEQLGNKVDVSPKPPQLIDTPEIREQYQNEQKQKEAELAAALKKQQEKLANHNQSEVLKKLAEQKRIELQKKEEEERRRAEAEYLLKLHAAAKLAYENNKKAKEQEGKTTVPSGTNQNSSSPSTPTSPKAPDWNNEQKPFVVYYKTGDQEEELPYESTEEADWNFQGISSIIAENDSVAAIHANGKYQVTGVTANQTTINQANGLYLIDLIQMDELVLAVTVQDVTSNSSHTYTLRYRVEQAIPPIIHPDEFQIIAERFINDNIQQKILNTVYQATPSPTYTSSPVLAGEADPSLLKIILKIPNALEVTVRDESTNQSVVVFPEDEGYSIEIPYSNDINVRVMTNEMRLYNIHIPLQRSINLGALFQLFVDDDLVAHQSTQYATEFLYRLSATDQLKTIKVKGADTYQITAFDAYPNVSVTNNASYYTLTLTEPSQTNEVQVYMTLSNGENIRNLYLKIIVEN